MEALKSKLVLSLVFAVFVLLPSIQARTVHYCGDKKQYSVSVKDVTINPDPIRRGKTATFSIFANTDETITGGKMVIEVSYFGFNVHSESKDLCQKTACPITAGDFEVSHSQVLPVFTPPGSYTLKMKMVGENKDQLTCVTFDFSIGFASEDASSVADS